MAQRDWCWMRDLILSPILLRDAEIIIFVAISSSWRSDVVIIVMMFVFSHDESVWPRVVLLCVRGLCSCYEILMRCWCSCFVRFWLILWARPDRRWCTRASRWARAVRCYGTCCSAPTSSSSTHSPTNRWASHTSSWRFQWTVTWTGSLSKRVAMRIWCQNVLNWH